MLRTVPNQRICLQLLRAECAIAYGAAAVSAAVEAPESLLDGGQLLIQAPEESRDPLGVES
ncbi:MAG: hypothetical protein ACP5P1_02075 [Acidimicrobiales bacterium]